MIVTLIRSFWICSLLIACVFAIGCTPAVIIPNASMFTGESGGCGSFHVYRFNDNRTIAISVYVDEKALAIGEGRAEIEVSAAKKGVQLQVLQFAQPPDSFFCDDVGGDPLPIATWEGISGTIEIDKSSSSPPAEFANATHRVSIVLKSITVKNSKTGKHAALSNIEIKDVWVGWLAG